MFCNFAAGAAGLWYWASRVRTPKKIITIEILDGVDHVTGELDQLAKALILQSRWNARAATCAALSAACQVATAFMPTCWG